MKNVRMLTRYLGILKFIFIEIMMLSVLCYLIYILYTDKILASYPVIYAGTVMVAFHFFVRIIKGIYFRKQGLRYYKDLPLSEIHIKKEYKCTRHSSTMLRSPLNKSLEVRQQKTSELNESFKKISFHINRIKKVTWLNMESVFMLIADASITILVAIMFLVASYGMQVVKIYTPPNKTLLTEWCMMAFICWGIILFIRDLKDEDTVIDPFLYEVKIKNAVSNDSYYFITIAEDERRRRIREYEDKCNWFKRLYKDLFVLLYKISEIISCSFIALFSSFGLIALHPYVWDLIEILIAIWMISGLCRYVLASIAYTVDKDIDMQDIVPVVGQIYVFEESENDKVKILLNDQKRITENE